MIYFDNKSNYVTLTLYYVKLRSQKPCLHNNRCDCSKTNGLTFSLPNARDCSQRGTCIKGLFRPPLEQKTKSCFQKFHLIGLLEEKPKCKILATILLLPVAMVIILADKIG